MSAVTRAAAAATRAVEVAVEVAAKARATAVSAARAIAMAMARNAAWMALRQTARTVAARTEAIGVGLEAMALTTARVRNSYPSADSHSRGSLSNGRTNHTPSQCLRHRSHYRH